LAFSALFLIIGAWSFAAPYDGSPDEKAHILHAYGVVSGEVLPKLASDESGTGAIHHVPAGLVQENCWRFKAQQTVACGGQPTGDTHLVTENVLAGRYNPLYYALVGLPIKISPDMSGVIGSRLLSAAGVAALLACAFLLMARTRARFYAGAFLLVFTPIMAHIGGAVNPNGWEIAAGFAFFAAGINVFLRKSGSPSRFELWVLGVSGFLLLVLRSGGPYIFAVALLTLLVPLGARKLAGLLRDRQLRPVLIAWTAGGLLAATWYLTMRPNEFTNRTDLDYTVREAVTYQMDWWDKYLDQFVGVMSYLDAPAPAYFYTIWLFLAGFVIVGAALISSRIWVTRLLLLVTGGAVVPTILQLISLNKTDFVLQGRYMLPILVGVPLLAAHVASEKPALQVYIRKLSWAFIFVLLPMHTAFLVVAMVRWQRGVEFAFTSPLEGSWLPVSGPAVPLLLSVVGVTALGATVWWLLSRLGTAEAEIPQTSIDDDTVSRDLQPASGRA
jgi:hypothetical protein